MALSFPLLWQQIKTTVGSMDSYYKSDPNTYFSTMLWLNLCDLAKQKQKVWPLCIFIYFTFKVEKFCSRHGNQCSFLGSFGASDNASIFVSDQYKQTFFPANRHWIKTKKTFLNKVFLLNM